MAVEATYRLVSIGFRHRHYPHGLACAAPEPVPGGWGRRPMHMDWRMIARKVSLRSRHGAIRPDWTGKWTTGRSRDRC